MAWNPCDGCWKPAPAGPSRAATCGLLYEGKNHKLVIMCISPLPAPQPSVSSYFCTHLALSIFFRHALTNQRDRFLLTLVDRSWWMKSWTVCVKCISLKTVPNGDVAIQEVGGGGVSKGNKQGRLGERELGNRPSRSNGEHSGKVRNASYHRQTEVKKMHSTSVFTA